MTALAKTVLFFCAGPAPTADEQSGIDQLSYVYKNVLVRDGASVATYGANLEPADALAGTIPAAYKTGEGDVVDTDDYPDGDVSPGIAAKPEALAVIPAVIALAHTGTFQAYAVSADVTGGVAALNERTSGASIAWGSSDATKATVSAGGLVTGVAAGTCVLTVTYTYSSGKTKTATAAVTLS